MVVERLPYIKFDDFFSLLFCLYKFEMLQFRIVSNILPLFLYSAIFFPDKSHKIAIRYFFIFLVDLDGTIQIPSVESSFSLILARKFHKTGELCLFDTSLKAIIEPEYLDSVINLFFSFLDDPFKTGINSFHLFRPIFVFQSSAKSILSFIIVDVVFNDFDIDFIAQSFISILKICDNLEISVR